MIHYHRLPVVPRWLVLLLVLPLVLGHACELSGLVGLESHPTEAAHHSTDDHSDENQISCDGVGVPSNMASLQAGPGLELAQPIPVTGPAIVRVVTLPLEDSKTLPSRPPLFLLYASLLI